MQREIDAAESEHIRVVRGADRLLKSLRALERKHNRPKGYHTKWLEKFGSKHAGLGHDKSDVEDGEDAKDLEG